MLRSKLTYANVVATLALFLAMSGGVVWAAHRIGANQLKSNSVGTSKIKRNAVTGKKIKKNAVTKDKIAEGAVDFSKIAKGTNVIGTATGGPVAVSVANTTPVAIPLTGTTSFTPEAGIVDLLNVEARGINLAPSGSEPCQATVQILVNGSLFQVSSGSLFLSSESTTLKNFTPVLLDSTTGPIGLTQPGVAQVITARVIGSTECKAGSQVSVALAVTQLK